MFIGVASLRTILSSVQEAFCHLPFYRYSVLDHCRSILSKRGAIQITYCICLLLRNSCLRHATVTTRIGKNLYVTDIVRITFKHTKSTSKKWYCELYPHEILKKQRTLPIRKTWRLENVDKMLPYNIQSFKISKIIQKRIFVIINVLFEDYI